MLRRIGILAIILSAVFLLFSACSSAASIISEKPVTGTITQVKKHRHSAGKTTTTKYHVFVQYENLSLFFHVSRGGVKNYKVEDAIAACLVTKQSADGSRRDELQRTCPHGKEE